jgi:hypothetical protein
MGTRSLTVVKEGKSELLCMYKQYDGYPEGHGQDLVNFLAPITLVNGISDRKAIIANGMGCLAAQLVAHFKTEPGNIYLQVPGSRDLGEEWIYTIHEKNGKIHLQVQSGRVTFFGLPGTKQANMPVLFDGPVTEFNAETINTAYGKLVDSIPNDFLDEQKAKQP